MPDEYKMPPEPERRREPRKRDRIEEIRQQLLRAVKFAIGGMVVTGGAAVVAIIIAAGANSGQVDKINDERYDNTLAACVGQNDRHDKAIKELDKFLPENGPPATRQARGGTLLLIEAIVPRRDCIEVAKKAVSR